MLFFVITSDAAIWSKPNSKIEQDERIVADYELLAISKAINVDILWLLGEKETIRI